MHMDIQTAAKKIMKRNGLSQADLAKEVGIHPVTLCLLLKDPKRPDTAYDKLVRYLQEQTKSLDVRGAAHE